MSTALASALPYSRARTVMNPPSSMDELELNSLGPDHNVQEPDRLDGSRPLRVLSVMNKLYWGGHERRVLQLAEAVDRSRFDHRVLIVTAPEQETEQQEMASGSMRQAFALAGHPVVDLGERADGKAGRVGFGRAVRASSSMIRIIRKLVRYIREHEIDVIDVHHTTAIVAGVLAARLTGVPVFISAYHVEPWKPVAMRLPGQLAFGLSSAIVTDSQVRADDIRSWMKTKDVPIHVVPTGVPVPVPTRSAAEVRRELGLPEDPRLKIVGQISGLIPFKGHDVLVEAAAQVLAQEPNTAFVCIGFNRGHDAYEAKLRARVTELGIADRVIFKGYPGEIGDVWQLIDVFAHPSKFDSLPLSVLEAMAVGKPGVMSAVGGIPEVITHDVNGLLVPPGEPGPLAEGIVKLLRDPQLRNRLGSAAREAHRAKFTPQAMARSLEGLYASLAAAK